MVPDFMHRDFFRSEEDALEPVEPGGRLNALRRTPQELEAGPAGSADFGAVMEVPRTEDEQPLPRTRSGKASAPTSRVEEKQPLPRMASATPQGEKLAPLRSSEPLPAALSGSPAPLRRDEASSAPSPPPPVNTEPVQPSLSPSAGKASSRYSVPLVGALLLVVGLFFWREQTRPVHTEQEALPVPRVVTVTDPSADSASSSQPSPAFRPSQVGVGPPAPAPTLTPASPLDLPDTVADADGLPEAAPESGEVEEAVGDDFSVQRAAVLERMSQSSSDAQGADARPALSEPSMNSGASSTNSDPGGLFPRTTPPASSAPVRTAPVAVPSSASVPPSAPKAAPAVQNNPADLFPIDEELPVKPVRQAVSTTAPPAPVKAVLKPTQVKAPAAPVPSALSPAQGDPYQIDEPRL